MRRHVRAFVLFAIASIPVHAQTAGEYLVTYASSLGGPAAAITHQGYLTDLLPRGTGFVPYDLTMDRDNEKILLVGASGRDDSIVRLWRSGFAQRVNAFTRVGIVDSIALDQDGHFVVSATKGMMRIVTNRTVDSIVPIGPAIVDATSLTVDLDTGDYLATTSPRNGTGALLRIDRNTFAVTTLVPNLGDAQAVKVEPSTGHFVVATRTAPPIRVYDRALRPVRTLALAITPSDLEISDDTGHYHVIEGSGVQPNGSSVRTITPQGVTIRSLAFGAYPRNPTFTGLAIRGSRNVAVAPAEPLLGGRYFIPVDVSFPSFAPGTSYQILASILGRRPGVPLPGGRRLNLAPDAVTAQLLAQGELLGVTRDFRGTLDVDSRAQGTMTFPANTPSGIRIFVTAVALRGSNLGIGNTAVAVTL